MVPPAIRSNLAGLRVRERALSFVWGVACTLSLALVLLLFACLLDWVIDRSQDTPTGVRVGMLLVQLVVLAVAGFLFIVWPQLRRLPDALLALWVEDKMPQFGHRLISAVQLNQPDADLGGMSKELVGIVTREAEKQSAQVGFAQIADHRRLGWAAGVFFPVLLVTAIPVLLWPALSLTLLARQFMAPLDVPHSVQLESITKQWAEGKDPVWPSGEEIELLYLVTGAWTEDMEGTVSVTPEGERTDRYPLKYHSPHERGAIFSARVNPAYVDITHAARLADGRTKTPSVLRIVARPVVIDYQAWVQVPTYCGLRPDGKRYEVAQVRSEVVAIPGSAVRVHIATQKPIKEAMLELRGPETVDPDKAGEDTLAREIERGKRPMLVSADGMSATVTFDLAEGLSAYRVFVKDEYGFDNGTPPRRSMRIVPEPPPEVRLLRDTFDAGRDDVIDLEGVPVVLGAPFRVPYRFDAPFGMQEARVLYRVLKKHESGNDPVEDEKWTVLPVSKEYVADPNPVLDKTIKRLHELIEEVAKTAGATKTALEKGNADSNLLKLLVESSREDIKAEIPKIENVITRLPKRSQVEESLKAARAGMKSASEVLDNKEVAQSLEYQTQALRELALVRVELGEAYTIFDQKTGVFACTPFNVEVPFHAVPPINPMVDWSRKLGGGRVFVSTKGIVDSTGRPVQLKTGDQIEFCMEVFARSRTLKGVDGREEVVKGPVGRSETRVATVVDSSEFTNWLQNVGKEEDRVRMLELRQKGIFDRVEPK